MTSSQHNDVQENNAYQVSVSVPRFRDGVWRLFDDTVTRESSVDIRWTDPLNKAPVTARLWAWPHDVAPLALGHVLLDRLPTAYCLHRQATVSATNESVFTVEVGPELPGSPPSPPDTWDAEELFKAMHNFISAAGLWDTTGCFHRTGVVDPVTNTLIARAEDIGRHNCIDRLAGWSVMNNAPLSDKVLLTSARLTSSLCSKALRAGFRILVSRSAVTTAAIAMAQEAHATLVGFARTAERRFTLFTDEARRLHYPTLSK